MKTTINCHSFEGHVYWGVKVLNGNGSYWATLTAIQGDTETQINVFGGHTGETVSVLHDLRAAIDAALSEEEVPDGQG